MRSIRKTRGIFRKKYSVYYLLCRFITYVQKYQRIFCENNVNIVFSVTSGTFFLNRRLQIPDVLASAAKPGDAGARQLQNLIIGHQFQESIQFGRASRQLDNQ